jgi:hypothetical protein
MRTLIAHRSAIALVLAIVSGMVGQHAYPFPADNPVLALIHFQNSSLFRALATLYAVLWYSTPFFGLQSVFAALNILLTAIAPAASFHPLPPYPALASRTEPFVILGEQHHAQIPERAPQPSWLTIPERGLHTGVAIFGAVGSGKTSACMYPYATQLLGWAANDPDRKLAGLVLEVKGDFCRSLKQILVAHGRADDYIELSLGGRYTYNPLEVETDAYAIAYSIATAINQLFGHSKEPFWQQAYVHLLTNIITAARLADGHTTLAEIYRYCISPDLLRDVIERARTRHVSRQVTVTRATFVSHQDRLAALASWQLGADDRAHTLYADGVRRELDDHQIPYEIADHPSAVSDEAAQQFEAVERWYRDEWLRLETRLRTSIVEGIAVFLGRFDDSPAVKRIFCPPAPGSPERGAHGLTPLPAIGELIETGKVLALHFPTSLNPGLSRILGVLLKQNFQKAMLARIPRLESGTNPSGRSVVLLIDEYQHFASAGGMDPSGDERFFALSRQARLIPIVATQSVSSLRSALADDATWRTLLQCFRTRMFLALSDDFSAQLAADICGRAYQARPEYTISEAGQDTTVSLLTGQAGAPKATITATKHYALRLDYIFQPAVFAGLRNGQAIVVPYDGFNPLPPTFCWLKPHYLDTQTSYFDHVNSGRL